MTVSLITSWTHSEIKGSVEPAQAKEETKKLLLPEQQSAHRRGRRAAYSKSESKYTRTRRSSSQD